MSLLLSLFVTLWALQCPPSTAEHAGRCVPQSCINEGMVCEGRGVCDRHGVCRYKDRQAVPHITKEPKECMDGELLCNGRGQCAQQPNGSYACECDEGFSLFGSSSHCVPNVCITGDKLCSGRGSCVDNRDTGEQGCNCNDLTIGDQCELCDQDGVEVNGKCIYKECVTTYPDGSQGECNDIGICGKLSGIYMCICSQLDSYTVDRFTCLAYSCLANDLTKGVCYRHGFCKGGKCVCDEGHSGTLCEHTSVGCNEGETLVGDKCYPTACISGMGDTLPVLCNAAGHCNYKTGVCECSIAYTGSLCTECADTAILVDGACIDAACITDEPDGSISVCNGHGKCIDGPENSVECLCDSDYRAIGTLFCYSSSCVRFNRLCNNRGTCVNDACQCDDDFYGEYCEFSRSCPSGHEYVLGYCVPDVCVTTYSDGQKAICGGYGHCVEKEDGPTCECIKDGRFINGACVSEKCITDKLNNVVCSNKGQCKGGVCSCDYDTLSPTC
ncbi:Tenascin-X [Giardia duodenalis ATCC 50581]|uniref:Tenascin-X n=1 Tax=Giardia intestinalis (strain ATCC 50581 / GS clone H7) TaxID=598745 RepID=C6LRU2_GIAIB|nr:Tenascin-X [Giardia intestinalis ATCC 50581]